MAGWDESQNLISCRGGTPKGRGGSGEREWGTSLDGKHTVWLMAPRINGHLNQDHSKPYPAQIGRGHIGSRHSSFCFDPSQFLRCLRGLWSQFTEVLGGVKMPHPSCIKTCHKDNYLISIFKIRSICKVNNNQVPRLSVCVTTGGPYNRQIKPLTLLPPPQSKKTLVEMKGTREMNKGMLPRLVPAQAPCSIPSSLPAVCSLIPHWLWPPTHPWP